MEVNYFKFTEAQRQLSKVDLQLAPSIIPRQVLHNPNFEPPAHTPGWMCVLGLEQSYAKTSCFPMCHKLGQSYDKIHCFPEGSA